MSKRRVWALENIRVIVEKPLSSTRVIVWCAFWSGGVIGPYFLDNKAGNAVTVNGLRYRDILTDLFGLLLMKCSFKRMASYSTQPLKH